MLHPKLESGTNRTPSLRGRRSIHQLDRYRRDIRRIGHQRRYGFDCDVRGMIMPGIESRNKGIKAIARGRAWFEELATGRARSLQELAKRDGISRRYIRRLIGLAFLSPQLVEAILQGRQPAELTATRLTELDLPLDWTEQRRLLVS